MHRKKTLETLLVFKVSLLHLQNKRNFTSVQSFQNKFEKQKLRKNNT